MECTGLRVKDLDFGQRQILVRDVTGGQARVTILPNSLIKSMHVWLEGKGQHPLGEEPLGGRFPADQWREGQVVRQWPDLQIPEGAPRGTYRLKMRMTRDGQPVPWGRGLIPLGSDLDLGPVQIGR